MKILYFFFTLNLLLLSACQKRTVIIPPPPKIIQTISYQQKMEVRVDGVECQDCVDTVLRQLRKLKGVSSVEFRNVRTSENSFEKGYFALYFDATINAVSSEEIQQALEMDGFKLKID